jgi:predicted NBD/HSP70 family sugar kinase
VGLASRANLAKEIGISQPTAGKIIDELLEFGLIEELEAESTDRAPSLTEAPRLGRPGRLLRLDAVRPRFVGIEIGVEQTRVAALPLGADGDAVWAAEFETGAAPREWTRRLRKHADAVTGDSLWGVVLSVPGIVDEAAGRVLFSPNLHWTEAVSLPELAREAWSLPALLVQEIRALALGHLATHPETENFLLVDFGEGVGGAVIERGQLLRHPLPLSAELGHTPVLGNQRPCGCGARGCVETLLSRRGIAASFGPGAPGPDLHASIAAHGLPVWLEQSLVAMGGIIAGALNTLGLRQVVVTGHLNTLPASVMDALTTATRLGAMWARFGDVTCETAPRRRMAGLVAAGLDRLLFPADRGGPLHLAARNRMRATARSRTRRRPVATVPRAPRTGATVS